MGDEPWVDETRFEEVEDREARGEPVDAATSVPKVWVVVKAVDDLLAAPLFVGLALKYAKEISSAVYPCL